ncbi:MAG: acyl-CoA dehydrogenase, partial [Agromyces sp.]|nr:acyl-CoA dehydrogenase [Agromyces sp.]
MPFEPLASDFYSYESLLDDRERAAIAELREWLEAEVRPVINGYWERAEFPTQFVKPLADLGVLSYAWDETRPFPNSAVFRGFVAMELARVDASIATFVGVQNGLVTGALSRCGSDEQRAHWIPRLASGELVGAFGL